MSDGWSLTATRQAYSYASRAVLDLDDLELPAGDDDAGITLDHAISIQLPPFEYDWNPSPHTEPTLDHAWLSNRGRFLGLPFGITAVSAAGMQDRLTTVVHCFNQEDFIVTYVPDISDTDTYYSWRLGPGQGSLPNEELDDMALIAGAQLLSYSCPIRETLNGPL